METPASIIVTLQIFEDHTLETGIPITSSNINRYTYRSSHTMRRLIIDIGLTRSLQLDGDKAEKARIFILGLFPNQHHIAY